MTRKNLGGLAIDLHTRALGADGAPVDGLFAAGELTGVAGINGSHGGSGTFLAPSVLMGRIAGRGAAEHAARTGIVATGFDTVTELTDAQAPVTPLDVRHVAALIGSGRAGYWHFEASHRVALERDYACERCHGADWPTGPAISTTAKLRQLDSCTSCH